MNAMWFPTKFVERVPSELVNDRRAAPPRLIGERVYTAGDLVLCGSR